MTSSRYIHHVRIVAALLVAVLLLSTASRSGLVGAQSPPAFSGPTPRRGEVGLLVTARGVTATEVVSLATSQGCGPITVGVLVRGLWNLHVAGAPAQVNAAFPALLAPSTPFFLRCGSPVATSGAPTPPTTSPASTASLGFGGDVGGRDARGGLVLAAAHTDGVTAFNILGDMSYDEITPEAAWCDWVRSKFPRPVQLISGNHEESGGEDGYIGNFAACLPDRMASTMGPGGYGANYYYDTGPLRVILIVPDLSVGGTHYAFDEGSAERSWLVSAIRAAPAWTIVGMHKVCFTMGEKSCEIGDSLPDLLHTEGVDLVLHAHDHQYQRSHSLRCSDPGTVPAACIADSGADGVYARKAGTVHVIAGTIGRSFYPCDSADSEAGYFAAHLCGDVTTSSLGYLKLDATAGTLTGTYRNVVGLPYTDTFEIR